MLSIIVAHANNMAIGKDGDIPWRISEDFKHFKKTTTGGTIVMGRKTYESIGHPLPNRRNIVLSRTMEPIEGVEVTTPEKLFDIVDRKRDNIFICGGEVIYRMYMPLADRMYVTKVDATIKDADTFFPTYNERDWLITNRTEIIGGANPSAVIVEYDRLTKEFL